MCSDDVILLNWVWQTVTLVCLREATVCSKLRLVKEGALSRPLGHGGGEDAHDTLLTCVCLSKNILSFVVTSYAPL